MAVGEFFLDSDNFQTQGHLNRITEWADKMSMKVNPRKSCYMIFNPCTSVPFQTRLTINDTPLEQVHDSRLLGLLLNDQISWHNNTNSLVQRAYQRMSILQNLAEYDIPKDDLIHIYKLYIRSVTEQNSVVWSSSITASEAAALERTQKCALRCIFQIEYKTYKTCLSRAHLSSLISVACY